MSDSLANPSVERPMVEVIIPVHRVDRPFKRAVASVLESDDPVGVIVVAHNVDPGLLAPELDEFGSRVRLLDLQDGVASPAGPRNVAFAAARAPWVACLDSDDYLEPGSVSTWVDYLEQHDPDVVILPVVSPENGKVDLPSVRPFRSHHLDPVKDRLFYRTAAFMLVRRALLSEQGICMTEGLRTGEDLAYSSHIFACAKKIARLPKGSPRYRQSDDGGPRVTGSLFPLPELVRPSLLLSQEKWVRELSPDVAKALTVRIIRHSLTPSMSRHIDDASIEDITIVREVLREWLTISPAAVRSLSVVEERLCAALLAGQDGSRYRECVRALTDGRKRDKVLPRRLSWLLEHDTRLRQWAALRIRRIIT